MHPSVRSIAPRLSITPSRLLISPRTATLYHTSTNSSTDRPIIFPDPQGKSPLLHYLPSRVIPKQGEILRKERVAFAFKVLRENDHGWLGHSAWRPETELQVRMLAQHNAPRQEDSRVNTACRSEQSSSNEPARPQEDVDSLSQHLDYRDDYDATTQPLSPPIDQKDMIDAINQVADLDSESRGHSSRKDEQLTRGKRDLKARVKADAGEDELELLSIVE